MSYGDDPYTQKVKVKGQPVQETVVETSGQRDGRTESIPFIIIRANTVGKYAPLNVLRGSRKKTRPRTQDESNLVSNLVRKCSPGKVYTVVIVFFNRRGY